MCTEIANILFDTAIMGANSNSARAVELYKSEGMSPEQAQRQVFLDNVGQVVQSGVGGAISGMTMAGVKGSIDYAGQQQYNKYLPQFETIAKQVYDAQMDGKIQQISLDQMSGEEKSDSQTLASDDIMSEARNSIKEDWADGEKREETRDDFTRRIVGEGFTVQTAGDEGKGGTVAYGYRVVYPEGRTREIQEGLRELGIQAFFIDGTVWYNYDGVSGRSSVPEAAAADGLGVFINGKATLPPMRVVGHEAFHFWMGIRARDTYVDTLRDNLDFASEVLHSYMGIFEHFYFEDAADLSDPKQEKLLMEELFAYISGDLHEGGHDDALRPMFRDFDAVKAAWKMLVETQRRRA